MSCPLFVRSSAVLLIVPFYNEIWVKTTILAIFFNYFFVFISNAF